MGSMRLVSSKGKKGSAQRAQQNYRESAAPDAPKRSKKRKSGAKTILIIILVLAIGLTAGVVALGFHIRSMDTVFPNVWADGVELSGLTFEEAVNALIAAGYEQNADNVSATIQFPNNTSFTISGSEVGFSLDAREAATAAFQFGREGATLENEITFIRAHMEVTNLRDLSIAQFDEDFVRTVVSEYTRQFNLAIIDDAYVIGEESIIIEIGTGMVPADEENVMALAVSTLFQALEAQTHLTVEYIPDEIYMTDDVDLQLLYDAISAEAVSAVYDRATFSATESAQGMTFDMDAATHMLENANRGDVIVIPLIVIEPEMTTEELNSRLFRDVLSETSTNIAGTAARLNNVTMAADFINETRLNPGDVFSFNETVGRRTTARGFQMAGAFAGGRLVDQPGGGICQTSSTLYYAVLLSNLQVLERREHGLRVAYIPLGHDAAIAWGQIDLRFRNDRDYPILIETIVEDRVITARITGTRVDDYTFTTDFVVLESNSFPTIRRADPTMEPGRERVDLPGSTGFLVEVFVSRLDADGDVVERWSIGRSRYNVQNRVIYYGPRPDAEEQPEMPQTPPSEGQPPSGDQTPQEPPDSGAGEPTPPTPQPPESPPSDDQQTTHEPPAEAPPIWPDEVVTEQPSVPPSDDTAGSDD
ncbi:MAG: VanW family protein [Oscillospiraceae bacterium]|nr:VanW family protein [Oscillospiraceae bacterium]